MWTHTHYSLYASCGYHEPNLSYWGSAQKGPHFLLRSQHTVFCMLFCTLYETYTTAYKKYTGPFLELGKAIIQSLRDAYWRACRMDVEAVHRNMDKDDRMHDKFYQHVTDQLSEREQHSRYISFSAPRRTGTYLKYMYVPKSVLPK